MHKVLRNLNFQSEFEAKPLRTAPHYSKGCKRLALFFPISESFWKVFSRYAAILSDSDRRNNEIEKNLLSKQYEIQNKW